MSLTGSEALYTGPDVGESYSLRIAALGNGDDSTVVEALLVRDDRFGIHGEININSEKRLTLLEGATFVDPSGAEVASDTLIAFHGFLDAVAHETIRVVNAPLEPAAFAFRAAPPTMSELEIVTTTTGTNLDPDGYTLTLDDSTTQAIETTETVVFSLPLGAHTVELQGVAANCTVQGYNPRDTLVLRGTATTVVSLEVSCGPSDVRVGQIAYEADGEIYVINADGSGLTNLTNNALRDINPTWSPDGSRLAFLRFRGGCSGDCYDSLDIYVVNADGGGETRIREGASISDGWWGRPDWSPDGAQLVFRQAAATPYLGEIYVMNADGSGVVQLTGNGENNSGPTWSPDGSRIAYGRYDPSGSRVDQIHVMNADGSGNVQITNEDSGGPVWSPNGGRIAFRTNGPGGGENRTFLVNPDGSDLVSLPYTEGEYGLAGVVTRRLADRVCSLG